IRMLQPAHRLTVSVGQLQLSRYWSIPTDFHLCYRHRRSEDVVEGFRETLAEAVRDRLRADRVSVELSGGLDSTSVAAMALELLPGGPPNLRAHCVSYARLFEDQEKEYADIAARAFGIAIEHVIADDFPLFETEVEGPPPPAPVHLGPMLGPWRTMASRMVNH